MAPPDPHCTFANLVRDSQNERIPLRMLTLIFSRNYHRWSFASTPLEIGSGTLKELPRVCGDD